MRIRNKLIGVLLAAVLMPVILQLAVNFKIQSIVNQGVSLEGLWGLYVGEKELKISTPSNLDSLKNLPSKPYKVVYEKTLPNAPFRPRFSTNERPNAPPFFGQKRLLRLRR